MSRSLLPLVLAALGGCDEEVIAVTIQPEPYWADVEDKQVTRGASLDYIDDRGILWQIDWRSATLSGPRFPPIVYDNADCDGTPYLPAEVPPSQAMWDPDEGVYKVVPPVVRIERLDDAWVRQGGCTRYGDLVIAYRLESVAEIGAFAPLINFFPPLHKVLPTP